MKRVLTILFLGIGVAALAYTGFYFTATAPSRAMMRCDNPELAWLKAEFRLNDAEFKRISELHAGYRPRCKELCQRIATKNAELKTMVGQTNQMTRDIEKKLAEIATLRAECQQHMLEHFFKVSQAMSPEQGKRYLAWIHEKTILCDHGGGEACGQSCHE